MTYIFLLFGIFILFAGAVLIVRPDFIMSHFKKYGDSFSLHFFAVFGRIILGVAFVMGSSGTKCPLILQIFGWLMIFAALVLSLIGRDKFKSLIRWTINLTSSFQRLMGVFAILFGCLIIYAVI